MLYKYNWLYAGFGGAGKGIGLSGLNVSCHKSSISEVGQTHHACRQYKVTSNNIELNLVTYLQVELT
jgi:hypothetical protein